MDPKSPNDALQLPRRVLLVDDSELSLELTAELLGEAGWTVAMATSGAAAVAAAGTEAPDVVVCDLHMPDMDGFEVIRRIRAVDGTLPVVILSSDENVTAVLDAVRRGAFDYVLKSDDTGPLVASMERGASHRRLLVENARLSSELKRANDDLAGRLDDAHAELKRRLAELDEQNRLLAHEVDARRATEVALIEARDRADRANYAKSSFLANMSHEVRTPLNAIFGYVELVRETIEDTSGDRVILGDIDRIMVASRHLLGLINDVLDLSKIEAGRMVLTFEEFQLADLCADLGATVSPLAAKQRNRFEFDVPATIGSMQADAGKLQQVLINLLGNAFKFTTDGVVRLSIRDHGASALVFEVIDSGIGMTPEQCERVFDPFVQAESTTMRKYGGTGLGLTIARALVRLHGGELTLASEVGKGTTFRIVLPRVARAAIEEPTAPEARVVLPNTVSGRPLVLVIDDDAATRSLLARFLTDDFSIASAASGFDGLTLARRYRPAAITLDVVMPGLDGWATLQILRSLQETAQIPVIIVSTIDDRARALALGASDHLLKPVSHAGLVQAIESAIARTDPSTPIAGVRALRLETPHSGVDVPAVREGL